MVGADLGVFDSVGIDTEDDFSIVFEFLEEFDFKVGEEARESAGGVLIVDELATEFEVEFVEHFDAAFDLSLLNFEILIGIKTFFHKPPLNYMFIIADGERECNGRLNGSALPRRYLPVVGM